MVYDEGILSRFWAKVNKRGPEECWLWEGSTNDNGYGRLWVVDRLVHAHRISYALDRGHEPTDCVLHRCDNPLCVNPAHLFGGTQADNMADKLAKGRGARGERNGGAKLTTAQALDIRWRALHGERGVDLAAEFGISKTTVSKIKHRRKWAHV